MNQQEPSSLLLSLNFTDDEIIDIVDSNLMDSVRKIRYSPKWKLSQDLQTVIPFVKELKKEFSVV